LQLIHDVAKSETVNCRPRLFSLSIHPVKVAAKRSQGFVPKQPPEIVMSRINVPTLEQSSEAVRPMLEAVKKQLGVVPNLFRLLGVSKSSLAGFLNQSGALGDSSLGGQTAERIALAVAEINGCSYCLSAHTYLAKHVAKLDDAEIALNREGGSSNAKADAAVRFAAKVVAMRGHVTDADVQAVKSAGFSDAEILDIVSVVALNTLTNYVNEVAKTDIDFPVVQGKRAA
jgi:uncharacterized peroxidase-related enzyme